MSSSAAVRRGAFRLPAAVAAVVLLVGCGGSTPTPAPTSTAAPTTSADPTSSPNPTPAAASGYEPGALDTGFGDGGLVMTDMGGGLDDHANAVAVQPDGKTIVAGEARKDPNSLATFALVRFNKDGKLDLSFGTGGKVFTPFDEFNGSGALAVAVQSDGKIVAAGHAANPDAHHDTFALARYNADGTLDDTFGKGGLVLTAIYGPTGAGPTDRANAVAIDSQGRIIVAGESGSFLYDFAVARYLADGSLDQSFGGKGFVVLDFGGDDRANALAVQSDGKIIVGGSGFLASGDDEIRGAEDFTPRSL